MPRDALYVFAYDVSEDRERDKVADVLEGFGFRLQKSVFECRLTRSGLGQVMGRLEALELASGFVAIYRTEERAKRSLIGAPPAADRPGVQATYALVV